MEDNEKPYELSIIRKKNYNDLTILERYISCMIGHALGDAIGYNNGKWEFMRNEDKIYQFIALGGINRIDLENWKVSDDTLIHIQMADSLLEINNGKNLDKYEELGQLAQVFKDALINVYEYFADQGYETHNPGRATIINIDKLSKGSEWDKLEYNNNFGGNGAVMRSLCIGLIYYKEEDFDKLISVSIEMARMTHNAVNGYLGAFYTALFVSYAMRGIEIEKWPFMLMKLYKDKVIENYIKKIGRDVEEYFRYAHNFYSKWDAYIKDKFDEYGNVINLRTTINLSWRSKYYESIQNVINPDAFTTAGSGGDDCLIIAYDSLLDAGDKWETLVFYAMLHTGDTDTTGCVAGGLYGVLYGMRDIPKINYKFLEHRDYIIRLAEKLYLKYN